MDWMEKALADRSNGVVFLEDGLSLTRCDLIHIHRLQNSSLTKAAQLPGLIRAAKTLHATSSFAIFEFLFSDGSRLIRRAI